MRVLTLLAVVGMLGATAVACSKDKSEDPASAVSSGSEDVGDKVDEAAKDTGDKVEEATE